MWFNLFSNIKFYRKNKRFYLLSSLFMLPNNLKEFCTFGSPMTFSMPPIPEDFGAFFCDSTALPRASRTFAKSFKELVECAWRGEGYLESENLKRYYRDNNLHHIKLSGLIKWEYVPSIVNDDDGDKFQFVHVFYMNNSGEYPTLGFLNPLLPTT